jgi:hypothetical protein
MSEAGVRLVHPGTTDQMIGNGWHVRSSERMPDGLWQATVTRVRSEFDEMPCMRLTPAQARVLFGLSESASDWVLNRLAQEGFLIQTDGGQYLRRSTAP